MIARRHDIAEREHGMVLVSSLLLLVVVTILAVSMFRSFGVQEKIAGNMREKQRALNVAETAQQFAEYWLSQGNGNNGIVCNAVVPSNPGQVCSNLPANFTTLPWKVGGVPVGVDYVPTAANSPVAMNVTSAGTQGSYYSAPRFYIAFLGPPPGGLGSVYQIDAVGYGGSPDTAAVVESTYLVQTSVKDLGAL
jgi:type IV pilus assembly protein PilX